MAKLFVPLVLIGCLQTKSFRLPCAGADCQPAVSIVSLGAVTLGPGEQTTLTWQSNAGGNYFIAAQASGQPEHVLVRGQVSANHALDFSLAASDLSLGSNEVRIVVVSGADRAGDASASVVVAQTTGGGSYQISGTLNGLVSGTLTLSDGADNLALTKNTSFVFPTPLATGTTYNLSVVSEPSSALNCVFDNAAGVVANSNISVAVTCQIAPRVFFSDLSSAPQSGGENGDGAYVTLYGVGFGASSGTVTLGGQPVLIKQWGASAQTARGLETIVVQLQSSITYPGGASFVVTVGTASSNSLAFAVQSQGHIYFVDAAAASNGSGTATSPFNSFTSLHKGNSSPLNKGDVVYLRGTFAAIDDATCNPNAVLCLDGNFASNATAQLPIAFVGYPGAGPTFNGSTASIGIDSFNDHYAFAELTFSDLAAASLQIEGTTGARVVGNTLLGSGGSDGNQLDVEPNGAFSTPSVNLFAAGNRFDNNLGAALDATAIMVAPNNSSVSNAEIGWNELSQQGGFGLELNFYNGSSIDTILIHDNLMANISAGALMVFGDDADNAQLTHLSVYNNLIFDSGASGLYLALAHTGEGGAGVAQVWANSIGVNVSDGSFTPGSWLFEIGALGGQYLDVESNLFFVNGSIDPEPDNDFVGTAASSGTSLPADVPVLAGNVYASSSGALAKPSWDASGIGPVATDFAQVANDDDFRLTSTSAARGVGAAMILPTDFRGAPRPARAPDAGAYQYSLGLDP